MTDDTRIDTSFDVRTDAGGKDPDSHSATLRRYHRRLWSKPLPDGTAFELDDRLHHQSDLGEFWLASDAITHTYSSGYPARMAAIVPQVPVEDVTAAYDLCCTIGAFGVFPYGARVDGVYKRSINQARGMHPRIRDRFDLTLECIRRHYQGAESPLAATMARHDDFFALFGSFAGYVDHFLLQDLVHDDGSIRFWIPFEDFTGDALPAADVAQYRGYLRRMTGFVTARNARIAAWDSAQEA